MNTRIWAIAKKEFFQLLRDRRTLPLILVIPVIQVILFGYVVAAEVKNISFAVFDQDHTEMSRELTAKLKNSSYFIDQGRIKKYNELDKLMAAGKIKIGLVIPVNFMRKVDRQMQPTLQVVVDGTDSNTAAIAQSYFLNIIDRFSQEIVTERLIKIGLGQVLAAPLAYQYRAYYNPDLRAPNFMIPAITVMVLMLTTTTLTALSIVKEKELGTIEQIMVTPVKPWEFILGKLFPFPFIGMLSVFLVVTLGDLWFEVPMKGSFLLLYLSAALFVMTTLGMGLLISTVSKTQQQALLSTIFFIMPSILLSGYIFPIANMPQVMQWLTFLIPARYYIEIVRAIYLKGLGINYLYPQMLALLIIGVAILGYSIKGFRKQIS